jgi:hypothetical protein
MKPQKKAFLVPPPRTVLKRQSDERIFCQPDLVKKTNVEETRTAIGFLSLNEGVSAIKSTSLATVMAKLN